MNNLALSTYWAGRAMDWREVYQAQKREFHRLQRQLRSIGKRRRLARIAGDFGPVLAYSHMIGDLHRRIDQAHGDMERARVAAVKLARLAKEINAL